MSSARLGRPTGRKIGVGLPPSPSPRSRSAGRFDVLERDRARYSDWARDSDYIPQRRAPVPPDGATPSRSVRSVRSAASMRGSSSYADVPAVPPLPLPRRSEISHKSSASTGSTSSYASSSGTSSSPFLDRVKGRVGHGHGSPASSSRTSLEDEPEPRKERESERGWWPRKRTAAMPEAKDVQRRDGDNELPVQPGYGVSLWSRVATAASTMTLGASKAWTSNIGGHSGELTPPGEESRLTRALKAYHIEKARNPADLPEWLFDERERRPLGPSGARFRHRDDSDEESRRAAAPPRPSGGRGVRDVDNAATASTAMPSRQRETGEPGRRRPNGDIPVGPPSIANDRLRAFRDAKRNAALRNASVTSARSFDPTGDEWAEREERGRSHRKDSGHLRSPSMPARMQPLQGGGIPSIRKI